MVKPPDFDKTFDTFSHEVKGFYKTKSISFIAWCTFWILNGANVIMLICAATPSWAWTHEMVGAGANRHFLEGEVYAFYGLWYMCWNQVHYSGGEPRDCMLWTGADYMPDWYPAFQAMMTLTGIFGLVSFMVIGFYMFAKGLNRNLRMISLFIFTSVMAAIFSITGLTVFVISFLHEAWWCCHPDLKRDMIQAELNWGFTVNCVGTGLYMIAAASGMYEIIDILKERRYMEEYEEWQRREAELEMEGFDPQTVAYYMNPLMNPAPPHLARPSYGQY